MVEIGKSPEERIQEAIGFIETMAQLDYGVKIDLEDRKAREGTLSRIARLELSTSIAANDYHIEVLEKIYSLLNPDHPLKEVVDRNSRIILVDGAIVDPRREQYG